MADKKMILGLFRNEEQAADAVVALKQSPWEFLRVHSPFFSHRIMLKSNLKQLYLFFCFICGQIRDKSIDKKEQDISFDSKLSNWSLWFFSTWSGFLSNFGLFIKFKINLQTSFWIELPTNVL